MSDTGNKMIPALPSKCSFITCVTDYAIRLDVLPFCCEMIFTITYEMIIYHLLHQIFVSVMRHFLKCIRKLKLFGMTNGFVLYKLLKPENIFPEGI